MCTAFEGTSKKGQHDCTDRNGRKYNTKALVSQRISDTNMTSIFFTGQLYYIQFTQSVLYSVAACVLCHLFLINIVMKLVQLLLSLPRVDTCPICPGNLAENASKDFFWQLVFSTYEPLHEFVRRKVSSPNIIITLYASWGLTYPGMWGIRAHYFCRIVAGQEGLDKQCSTVFMYSRVELFVEKYFWVLYT